MREKTTVQCWSFWLHKAFEPHESFPLVFMDSVKIFIGSAVILFWLLAHILIFSFSLFIWRAKLPTLICMFEFLTALLHFPLFSIVCIPLSFSFPCFPFSTSLFPLFYPCFSTTCFSLLLQVYMWKLLLLLCVNPGEQHKDVGHINISRWWLFIMLITTVPRVQPRPNLLC